MAEDLLRRIDDLQHTRDALVAANEELLTGHDELRKRLAEAATSSADAAGHASKPKEEDSDVRSRFAKFVSEAVEKRDWKAEADRLAADVEAMSKSAESSLTASQLNVRLLQEAVRSLTIERDRCREQLAASSSPPLPAGGSGKASTPPSTPPHKTEGQRAMGDNGEHCRRAEEKAREACERAAAAEAALARFKRDSASSLEEAVHMRLSAEQKAEELTAKCGALQQALDAATASRPDEKHTDPHRNDADDDDVDFDFDEFDDDPKTTGPSHKAGGPAKGPASSKKDATSDLLDVALSEVKREKKRVQELTEANRSLQRDLAKRVQDSEQASTEARESMARKQAESSAETAAERDRADAEARRREVAEERLAGLEAEAAERTEQHEVELHRRDAMIKELRSTLTALKASGGGDRTAQRDRAARRSAAATPAGSSDDEHSAADDEPFTTQETKSTQTVALVADQPPRVQPPAPQQQQQHTPPEHHQAMTTSSGPPSSSSGGGSGGLSKLRGFFGHRSSSSSSSGGSAAASGAAAMQSEPVQKLRRLLEETLAENIRLSARIAELEAR